MNRNVIIIIGLALLLLSCSEKKTYNKVPIIIFKDGNHTIIENGSCNPIIIAPNGEYIFYISLSDSSFYELDVNTICEKEHIKIQPIISVNDSSISVINNEGRGSVIFSEEYIEKHTRSNDLIYVDVKIKFPTEQSGDCTISKRLFFKIGVGSVSK